MSSDIIFNFRKDMFVHLQCLPSHYFDRVNTGDILSKFNYEVLQLTDSAINAVVTFVRKGVLVVVMLSYFFIKIGK